MRIRTQRTAGAIGIAVKHAGALQVRSAVKAGNSQGAGRPAIGMRQHVRATASKEDRLELMVVRGSLRAGARAGNRHFGRYGR